MGQERKLWEAVVKRAAAEAQGWVLKEERGDAMACARVKRLARRWLTAWSRSFITVCQYAGVDEGGTRVLHERFKREFGKRRQDL